MNSLLYHPDLTPTNNGHFENDKYVFFWGGPFSNWFPEEFVMDTPNGSLPFNCSEQAMMFFKALLFDDEVTATKIMRERSPRQQKVFGKEVKNFNQKHWHTKCVDIVTDILVSKFLANDVMFKILMDTGNKIIVEASPHDRIWGIGMAVNDQNILDESKWDGTNFLGISLMNARAILKGECDAIEGN